MATETNPRAMAKVVWSRLGDQPSARVGRHAGAIVAAAGEQQYAVHDQPIADRTGPQNFDRLAERTHQ